MIIRRARPASLGGPSKELMVQGGCLTYTERLTPFFAYTVSNPSSPYTCLRCRLAMEHHEDFDHLLCWHLVQQLGRALQDSRQGAP